MFVSEHRRQVLRAIRPTPLTAHAIAAEIERPTWAVREILRTLKRDQLVSELWESRRRLWSLTAAGAGVIWEESQLALGEVVS